MHNSEPSDFSCDRPCLGDRISRRQPIATSVSTPAELAAREQAIEEANRDIAAWFDDYHLAIKRRAKRAGADSHLAEDIAQDVFLKALRQRQGGFVPEKPVGWLVRAAGTETVTAHRKNSLHRRALSILAERAAESANQAETEAEMAETQAETTTLVWAAIDSLDAVQQKIAIDYLHEKSMTRKEIAAELGLATSTVDKHIWRTREALRRLLARLSEADRDGWIY